MGPELAAAVAADAPRGTWRTRGAGPGTGGQWPRGALRLLFGRVRRLSGEAVEHQVEGEVEPLVSAAGGQFGGVVSGAGEAVGGQGAEAVQEFVAAEDPFVV